MGQVPAPLPDKSPKKVKVSTPWWICGSSKVKLPKPVRPIIPTSSRPKTPDLDEPEKLKRKRFPSSDNYIK